MKQGPPEADSAPDESTPATSAGTAPTVALLERRLKRERAAREQAEALLEQKSLELYERNQQLATENAERLRAERTVADTRLRAGMEERFRQVVEAAPSAMIMVNRAGEITLVNEQTEKLFGYDRDSLLGQKVEMLVPAAMRAAHPATREGYFAKPQPRAMGVGRDLYGRRSDGHEVPIEIGLNPINTAEGSFVLASIIDITERKRLEQRLALIVESAPNALVMIDRTGRITLINAQAEKMFGHPRAELVGRSADTLLPLRLRKPGTRSEYFSATAKSAPGPARELFGLTKDGRELPIEIGLSLIETADDTLTLASISDISERKRLEERFRLAVEAAPNAMMMIDEHGIIALANAQATALFGYPAEKLVGSDAEQLVPPRIRQRRPGMRTGYFMSPHVRPIGVGRELFGYTKDQREVPIEIGLNPIETSDGRFMLATIVDITERKRAEKTLTDLNATLEAQVGETRNALARLQETQNQLVQAEKLASLGGLVAGVAHEINTPVGIGVTAASYLHDQVNTVLAASAGGTLTKAQFQRFLEDSKQSADIILGNLQRAAELIQSFKRVAADQSSDERRRVNLKSYVGEVLLSLRPKFRATALKMEVRIDDSIELDTVPGALSQIITNLVMNALIHAYTSQQAGTIGIRAERQGESIVMQVSDDGCGIPPENLARVFDPFFTTRRGHGGTGLGLHIVFNIVHKTLGGTITVASTLGQGTTFTLNIPEQLNTHEPAA